LPQAQQPRRGKKVGRRQQQQQQQGRRPQAQRAAEPALPMLELAEAEGSTAPIASTAISGARRAGGGGGGGGGTSANAATLRQWLTPQTLRSQYILTEILQPPLALRPDRLES
jgi:hypothetical protein